MATILVVAGERSLRDQLHSILSSLGHEVLLAQSSIEGLELFRQRKPRFTLLDFQPPDMNGLDVLRQIRQLFPQAAVIMLDGGVPGDVKLQAWQLGAVDFMKKDLSLKVLSNAIGRALLRPPRMTDVSQGATATAEPSASKPGSESILIVDDEPELCNMVSTYLTKLGYRVLAASNGHEALARVAQEEFTLIIIDIYLPVMDGLALARELRARKYAGSILALTGSLDEDKLQGMLDLGAFDVIGKPPDMARLELAVHLGCVLAS